MNEYFLIGILLGIPVALALERIFNWLLSPIDRWLDIEPAEHVTQTDVEKALADGEKGEYQLTKVLRKQGVRLSADFPLYGLLHSMEDRGLIASRVSADPDGKTRRYWRLADKES